MLSVRGMLIQKGTTGVTHSVCMGADGGGNWGGARAALLPSGR